MANSRETLALVLKKFAAQGLSCDVFGGWAEELLGLRQPGRHGDIDLIYRGDNFAAFEMIGRDFRPVPLKRFRHKRAFMFRDVLCEIILVQDAGTRPVTHYWGDVPFYWNPPLLHGQTIDILDQSVTLVSAENLQRHRRLHLDTQPSRWRDPRSIEP